MKTLIVGEDNPYGGDPRYALYPMPVNSAGGRLCRLIMRMDVKTYISRFDRANLCTGRWQVAEARERAASLRNDARYRTILMGAKVAAAWFGEPTAPWQKFILPEGIVITIPHPSGRNRAWNDGTAFERAHQLILSAGVDLSPRVWGRRCENCGGVVTSTCKECGPGPTVEEEPWHREAT